MISGLKLVRKIKETERFVSFEAELNGQKVFAKQAKSENTQIHLSFQSKNSRTVDGLGGNLFRAPKIIAQDSEWIVTEWLDGEPLEAKLKNNPSYVAEALAEVIGVFDAQPDSETALRPIFTYEGLKERIGERIHPEIRHINPELFADSLELFKKHSQKLQACLQDADVQPEHLFADPTHKAEFVLVDSEHLNTHWPRFYDLANNYSKYWKRDNRAFSAQMLKAYLEVCKYDREAIFEPLCASLMVRAFALHWENDYDPGALDTNIPRAQKLLQKILQANRLDDLL